MTTEKLNQAVQLIKAGNKQAALPFLKQVIQSEPNNESAWLWLYSCLDDTSQKKYCLQKVLEINPDNTDARNALEKLFFVDTIISADKPITSKKPTTSSSQEKIYYKQDPVLVTSHRVVFGGETHVLRNITSVGSVKLPASRVTGIIIAIVGIIIFFSAFGANETFAASSVKGMVVFGLAETAVFLGLITIIVGVVVSIRAKPRYVVRLVSSSSEINGFKSTDQKHISTIVESINRAIAENG